MSDKLPAMMFYPGDWRKDPALQSCSFAARGLWMEMLCLMHEVPRRGYLELAGRPVTPEQLARMVGGSAAEIAPLLAELDAAGVFSRDDRGVIYSRRMERDEHIRRVRSEAGKLGAPHGHKGGRPAKSEHQKRQKRQTERQTNPPSSSDASSVSDSEKASPSEGEEKTQERRPRKRNAVFDAVAAVTGADPIAAASLLGSVSAALGKSDPPYTPDDVREFARRFWEICPWAKNDDRTRPTPRELQNHIGKLRAAPALVEKYDSAMPAPDFDF